MSTLDPQLRIIENQRSRTNAARMSEGLDFAVEAESGSPTLVTVLVEHSATEEELEAAGLTVRTIAGDVATGVIDIDSLASLGDTDGVHRVEASRPLHDELDLSLTSSNVDPVHAGPPGLRGSGVIVGIIDSGIEFDHPNFLRPDGTSRILAIWDQRLTATGGESTPAAFNYGVEYSSSDLDAEIADGMQGNIVRHRDSPGARFHGTHVTGIAAGDGSKAGGGQPAFSFVGVAPEADIVVVRNSGGGGRGIGDSANTVDAIKYIYDMAATAGRPAVINQSQGDNLGPHDGTSLLERAIDNMLGSQGRAMVKSAGNAADDRIHASGSVALGATETVRFNVPAGRERAVTIDLWYDGSDRFDVKVTAPGGAGSATASAGSGLTVENFSSTRLIVDSDLNDPANGDNRIFIQTFPTSGTGTVVAGTWQIELTATRASDGRFDAWLQRSNANRPTFRAPHENPQRTISTPGTAREIITAASYINRGPGKGSISTFSSLGPTRDGRQAPTVAAPGQRVESASPLVLPPMSPPGVTAVYQQQSGTSMAAPHVAGAVALMLQQNPQLTQREIKDCLEQSAVSNQATGATPNNAWGHGILDVAAAVRCRVLPPLTTIIPPCFPTIRPPCSTLAPPCPQPTLRPPCNIVSLTVPCLPTMRPPCLPTLAPPCGGPSLRVPCGPIPPPPSIRPPCVVEGDPASVPTVDYEAPTDAPGEAGETAAGWGPVEDWGGIDAGGVAAYNPALWDETDWDSSGETGSEFGSTDAWYGNDGYGH